MKKGDEVDVYIYNISLDITKEKLSQLKSLLVEDKTLNKALKEYSIELEKEDIEVWDIDRNLMTTERGHLIALFENSDDM